MDGKGLILDVVAQWPGCTNDARILNNSELARRFEEGRLRGILLGDSGYPLKTWLMTPIGQPQNAAEEAYNR